MPDQPADTSRPHDAEAPGDLRRMLLVGAVLASPIALLGAILYLWLSSATETFGPIAHRGGWIAFVQRVDRAFPADTDSTVWLGRSIEAPRTWHQLAPTDAVEVRSFAWLSGQHLLITLADAPPPGLVQTVEDVTIEWRH